MNGAALGSGIELCLVVVVDVEVVVAEPEGEVVAYIDFCPPMR